MGKGALCTESIPVQFFKVKLGVQVCIQFSSLISKRGTLVLPGTLKALAHVHPLLTLEGDSRIGDALGTG